MLTLRVTEVERATALLRLHAVGKTIHHIDAFEDNLVFCGCTHDDFVGHSLSRALDSTHPRFTGSRDHRPGGRKGCSLW